MVLSVERAIEYLKEHEASAPGYKSFDVSLENGQQIVVKVTLDHFGVDSFYATMDEFATHKLIITLRSLQGASWRHGESFTVSAKPSPPNNQMDTPQKQSPFQDAFFQLMLSSKEERIQEMQRSLNLLENSLKSSEKEIYDLKQKNMELERENKLKDANFNLEKRNWEVEKEREDYKKDSEGLNGVVGGIERLAGNPAVLEIAKVWLASRAGQPQQQLGAGSEGVDVAPHAQAYVQQFITFMNHQEPQRAKQFFAVVSSLATQPHAWADVHSLLTNKAA